MTLRGFFQLLAGIFAIFFLISTFFWGSIPLMVVCAIGAWACIQASNDPYRLDPW